MKIEYRLVWQRSGQRRKSRRFIYKKTLDRFMTLMGPEPWKAYGKSPDDYDCCNGRECGCGGLTMQQRSDLRRQEMPAIEFKRVEVREVGDWVGWPQDGKE